MSQHADDKPGVSVRESVHPAPEDTARVEAEIMSPTDGGGDTLTRSSTDISSIVGNVTREETQEREVMNDTDTPHYTDVLPS